MPDLLPNGGLLEHAVDGNGDPAEQKQPVAGQGRSQPPVPLPLHRQHKGRQERGPQGGNGQAARRARRAQQGRKTVRPHLARRQGRDRQIDQRRHLVSRDQQGGAYIPGRAGGPCRQRPPHCGQIAPGYLEGPAGPAPALLHRLPEGQGLLVIGDRLGDPKDLDLLQGALD